MRLYLIVPSNGTHRSTWVAKMKRYLANNARIRKFVFHSYHAKAWPSNGKRIRFPLSRAILVEDQTEHFDEYLLGAAKKLYSRAHERGYKVISALKIVEHYLLNMQYMTYEGEARYHQKRAKDIKRYLKKIKGKDLGEIDHGWEIEELKKARLIK